MDVTTVVHIDFEHGSADELLSALLPCLTGADMWRGLLQNLLNAFVPAFVELRDANQRVGNKASFCAILKLNNVVRLAKNVHLSNGNRQPLDSYLTGLPNFVNRTTAPQAETMHRFLTMPLAAVLR